MSRLGKLPVDVPNGVKTVIQNGTFNVEGPKGKMSMPIPEGIDVVLEGSQVITNRKGDSAQERAYHGLARSLVFNLVKGVSDGFSKTLIITGVGYRAQAKGQTLGLTLGFSHPVDFPLPATVTAKVEGNTTVILESPDKALLGDVAAKIRSLRPPEPYQGKGIRYSDEVIKRKAGKAAAK
ncbi:50S ribosomal protein L6 [bacterium]|nr:50S ribosomal protein L6 [bacterium]